jgi:hypothetical protein
MFSNSINRLQNKTRKERYADSTNGKGVRYSGGLVLRDPDPSLGIEAVRQAYASSYPENYHGRGERSGIGGRKTGLHVQDGSGHKKLTGFSWPNPE